MFAFFPAPYEDELLYSLCARYARLAGHGDLKTNLEYFFGRRTVTAVADLPAHLDTFAARLAHLGGPSADQLIDRHTLLPFFAAFHPAERREEARSAMRSEGHPHWLLGLMASRVPNSRALRYCPSCAGEERARLGEAYWHRLHQLPGVLVCDRHSVWLEESEVVLPAPVTRHAFVAAEVVIPRGGLARQLARGGEQTLALDLARRAHTLLESPPVDVPPPTLRERYLAALAERELATFSGRLRLQELRAAFSAFCPADVLERLGLSAEDDGWLLRLLRKPRVAAHTLHHLLMQAFLQLDRDALSTAARPFGAGPWPCLNRASAHYGECRISTVQIDYTCNERKPIGTFACSCGFAYRRVGPDSTPEDALRLDRMASYGSVWLRALRRGWLDSDLSLRELSRQLGFDPHTVRARAAKLGLPITRPGSRDAKAPDVLPRVQPEVPFPERRRAYRSAWSRARREQPGASIRGLRRYAPAEYIWLYRHDRAWLNRNKPARRLPKASAPRVHWKQRDTALTRELRLAARDLLRRERPVRVTPSRLAREVRQAAVLAQHLDKLPRCKRTLAELGETREAFAVRRVRQAAARLHESGERVPRWRFARLSGLRPELLAVPEVAHAFERAWAALLARFEVPAA